MVISTSYEWPTTKWFIQGLFASVVSGVGFVFIALAIEYAKRYRREKREQEQQIILQKLLRGEVSMQWNNSKALVPEKRGYSFDNLPLTSRGPHLFNSYKQHGGYLGFGRGYYGSRHKTVETTKNGTEDVTGRMHPITSWSHRNEEQMLSRLEDSESQTEDENDDDTVQIFSQSDMEANKPAQRRTPVYNRLNAEPSQKAPKQGPICQKTCQQMCYKIVKRHPFIAPFIRSDVLQELQLEVAAQPESARPFVPSRAPSQVFQKASPCRQPSSIEASMVNNFKPNIPKRTRSMSRHPRAKNRRSDSELKKHGGSFLNNGNPPNILKKDEAGTFKKNPEAKPECRRVHSNVSSQSSPKAIRRGRSFSVSAKRHKNKLQQTEGESQLDHVAKCRLKDTKRYSHVFCETMCSDIASQGSSVDPSDSPTAAMRRACAGKDAASENHLERNSRSDRNIFQICMEQVSILNSTKSGEANTTTAEGRVDEIVSALTSWGFPIKNEVRHNQPDALSGMQQNAPERCGQSYENQSKLENNTAANTFDSGLIVDIIKNMASSGKNRKFLRQISYVLNSNKISCKSHENSKSLTRTSSRSTTPGLTRTKSMTFVHHGKFKKNTGVSKGTEYKMPQDKSTVDCKTCRMNKWRSVTRERHVSPKFSHERLNAFTKRARNKESNKQMTYVIPFRNASNISPSEVETKSTGTGTLQSEVITRKISPERSISHVSPIRNAQQTAPGEINGNNYLLADAYSRAAPPHKCRNKLTDLEEDNSNAVVDQESSTSESNGNNGSPVTTVFKSEVDRAKTLKYSSPMKMKPSKSVRKNNNYESTESETENNEVCMIPLSETVEDKHSDSNEVSSNSLAYSSDKKVNSINRVNREASCDKEPSRPVTPKNKQKLQKSPNSKKKTKSTSTPITEPETFLKQSEPNDAVLVKTQRKDEKKKLVSNNKKKQIQPASGVDHFPNESRKAKLTSKDKEADERKQHTSGLHKKLAKKSRTETNNDKEECKKQLRKTGSSLVNAKTGKSKNQAPESMKDGPKNKHNNDKASVDKPEKGRAASKKCKEKPTEARSRFDQYQNNIKSGKGDRLRDLKSKEIKPSHVEFNRNINQASIQHVHIKATVDNVCIPEKSTHASFNCKCQPMSHAENSGNSSGQIISCQVTQNMSQIRHSPCPDFSMLAPDATAIPHCSNTQVYEVHCGEIDFDSAKTGQNCLQIMNRYLTLHNKSNEHSERPNSGGDIVTGKTTQQFTCQSSEPLKKSFLENVKSMLISKPKVATTASKNAKPK